MTKNIGFKNADQELKKNPLLTGKEKVTITFLVIISFFLVMLLIGINKLEEESSHRYEQAEKSIKIEAVSSNQYIASLVGRNVKFLVKIEDNLLWMGGIVEKVYSGESIIIRSNDIDDPNFIAEVLIKQKSINIIVSNIRVSNEKERRTSESKNTKDKGSPKL